MTVFGIASSKGMYEVPQVPRSIESYARLPLLRKLRIGREDTEPEKWIYRSHYVSTLIFSLLENQYCSRWQYFHQ